MKFKEILSTKTKNEVYLNRYLSFVDNCQRRNDATDLGNIYCEKHHILPKSDFPEYRSDPDNIVLLTGRQHFLSHWMLAKAVAPSDHRKLCQGGKIISPAPYQKQTLVKSAHRNSRIKSVSDSKAKPLSGIPVVDISWWTVMIFDGSQVK